MAHKKAQLTENSTKIRKAICFAALEVASRQPWEFVPLAEIADSAGLKVSDIQRHYASKSEIVADIVRAIDDEVEECFQDMDSQLSHRDRLFDVLMERIDIANQNREAHISILKAFGWSKEATCADINLLKSSMTRMCHCAGIEVNSLKGMMNVVAVSLAYSWVLLTWMKDTSPDLGKTMAELDKTLGRLESLAGYISRATETSV